MHPRYLKNYTDELYRLLKNEESVEKKVYACSQHVPTIGIGYALAEKSAGGFKPRSGLDDDLAKIGKSLTRGDKGRLAKICEMLNNGSVKEAIIGSEFKEPFELTITEEQAMQLFLLCVPQYDAVIRQKLGLKLYRELQNSKEMVTLFSLAYNAHALIGKGLVSALREGNRAKVQYEILYGSNLKHDPGLVNRRKKEAREFGRYDGDAPTPEELRAEEEVKKVHAVQIANYDAEMSAKRKGKSAKMASGPKTAANNHRKRQQPGTVPNQKEVKRRIDEVKAHQRNQRQSIFERVLDLFGSHDKVTYRDWNDHPASFDTRHYHKRWS